MSEIEQQLTQYLKSQPTDANAWEKFGTILFEQNDHPTAQKAYETAYALGNECLQVLVHLAIIYLQKFQLDDAQQLLEKADIKFPNNQYAQHNLAIVYERQGKFDHAEKLYSKLVIDFPEYFEASISLAMFYLKTSVFAKAWPLYEQRLALPSYNLKAPHLTKWEGQKCSDLVVYFEQALGDFFLMLPFLQLLKSKADRIYLICPKNLHKFICILKRFPIYGISEHIKLLPIKEGHYIHMMSLGQMLKLDKKKLQKQSALALKKHKIPTWLQNLDTINSPKLKIGLVWKGRSDYQTAHRSLALDQFMGLINQCSQAKWVSIQQETTAQEQKILEKLNVFNASQQLTDFFQTAILINQLDLVISVDTSVAHLADRLGKPVWVLLSKNVDWRWQIDADNSDWFPNAKLFRQTVYKQWSDIIHNIQVSLDALVLEKY